MVEQNQMFAEGVFINRPPLFTGESYPFWKVRMPIFLEFVHRGIWDAAINGHFVLTIIVNNVNLSSFCNGLCKKIECLDMWFNL